MDRLAAAGRVPGKPLGLVGHGLRERQLRGPPSATEAATTRALRVRRYRCRGCGAIVSAGPRQLLARRHFMAGAIGLALFVFGKLARSADEAAARVGSWGRGPGAWRTLRRWLGAIEAGRLFSCVRAAPRGWPPRRRAERAAMTLAALVPTTLGATEDTRVFAWTRSLRDAPADVAARVQASTTLGRFGIAWPVMWSLRAHRGAEKGPQK